MGGVTDDANPVFFRLDEVPWEDDRASGAVPAGMLDEADRRGGGGRKLLAAGEGGFHSSYSVVPPGFVMPAHRHDTDELVVVLAGACEWDDGSALEAGDTVIIPAGTVHGYTCGADGMTLLTVAHDAIRTELVD